MKRRYKAGDWIRVPLGGTRDALGIIARACRSRLFGYFFSVPHSHIPTHDELRALRAEKALVAVLFGGAPIEQARWPIVATSLAFDPQAWPFPDFASRGAFGRTWTRVRYDPISMQIVERTPLEPAAAADLADAKFADAHEVEALLRVRLGHRQTTRAYGVYELRSPLDDGMLRSMDAARVQFSTPLRAPDITVLAAFVRDHPEIDLRVHGFRHGFDAALLQQCSALQSLTLDVRQVQRAHALRALTGLRTLRIGALRIDLAFLEALHALERLELRGTRALLEPLLNCPSLTYLVLENTPSLDFHAFASASRVTTLVLAHGAYDLTSLNAFQQLRSLELRGLDASSLPDFAALTQLERLHLDALTGVTDLRPLTGARLLRELRITAMPQLNVEHFRPLQACAELREFFVDVGSRTKEREIYRLMLRGNT
jgi:hypothetical protein